MLLDTSNELAQIATKAIHAGDLETLRNLLKMQPHLATAYIGTANEGRTLLHILADHPGQLPNASETARSIIAAGADINAQFLGDLHSETALHWAASNNDIALLDTLLHLGADINARGGVIDETPLADARAFLQFEAANRLIARGAKATLQDLATLGLLERVRKFYCEGSDFPTGQETDCAFWNACHGGQLAAARFLREMGADVDFVPPWEDLTPLDAARRSDAGDVVEWLVGLGAVGFSMLTGQSEKKW